jgi:hypothetical protein
MSEIEALEWMRGERSMANIIPQDPFETWQTRIAVADAAKTEQAYWVLRHYRENKEAK